MKVGNQREDTGRSRRAGWSDGGGWSSSGDQEIMALEQRQPKKWACLAGLLATFFCFFLLYLTLLASFIFDLILTAKDLDISVEHRNLVLNLRIFNIEIFGSFYRLQRVRIDLTTNFV